MNGESQRSVRRARVLGRGTIVTLECAEKGDRLRMRVVQRAGRSVSLEPLHGRGPIPAAVAGSQVMLRVARPFGLFVYKAEMGRVEGEGPVQLLLSETPPRRRQLRHFFRMPVRMGVVLGPSDSGEPAPVLRASNLSGNGILLFDPTERLSLNSSVQVGLPIGPKGEILRLNARVVRVEDAHPRRAALGFEGISEGARKAILRYLVREHRRRSSVPAEATTGKIISINRSI